MKHDNYRPRSPESSPGAFGDSGSVPMTDKSRKPGYSLGKSLPGCDVGCLGHESGYMSQGAIDKADTASDKGFA